MDKSQIYRQKILSCAKEILEINGEDAITIDNIARKCKISKSTFYNYFSNKEDLINHLNSFSDIDGFFVSGTRELILLKAIEAFPRFGFNEIDMDKIAKLAKIKRTTIYNYFSSKEELWENCIRYIVDKQKSIIESIVLADENPVEVMDNYIDSLFKLENEYYNAIIIVSKYHYISNKKMQELLKELIDIKIKLFSSIIENGKQKGSYKKDINSINTAKLITTFLFGLSFIDAEDIGESKKKLFNLLHNFIKENNLSKEVHEP
ncbi:TetR/AcrR family transcriptional regulator [Proteiniborus sp. MB09-C3]|uniref:TetR/AcrR family transcriptional regulator n=1 Tax=Proteiniborus sp. MB09-C3 TaxID=3050072 RepID=UPI002553F1F5|nr:TetR/AcrR family transcriptional regulator [Proteiniborus sp. MB09-C3]WIV13334.1 TetR/AcrR family transcriptional regulator [Proteiniborus sp. MB09-C3]